MRSSIRTGLLLRSIVAILALAACAFGQSPLLPQLKPAAVAAAPAPATSAPAAKDATPAATTAAQADPTVNKRAENAELLKVAQQKLDASDPSDADAAQAVANFTSVEAVLAQQETLDQQLKDLTARKNDLDKRLKAMRGGDQTEVQPCSFLQLDKFKDKLYGEQSRTSLVADKVAAASAALERAQRDSEESQKSQRKAQEAVDTNRDETKTADLASDLEQSKQATKLAAETVTLRQKEKDAAALDQQNRKLTIDLLKEKVSRLRAMATFADADLDDQLTQIKRQEDGLSAAEVKVQANLRTAQVNLPMLQKQFDAAQGDAKPALAEKVEAWKRAIETYSTEDTVLTRQTQRLADMRMAWNQRFQIATHKLEGTDEESWGRLKEWQKSTHDALDELTAENRSQILNMVDLRSELVAITKKADDAKDGPHEIAHWIAQQRSYLENTLHVYETNMVSLETSRRLHEKLLDEIGINVDTISPTQLAIGTWYNITQMWDQELFKINVDNQDRAIRVRTVVGGLIMFVAGLIASRLVSAFLANRLLRRFHLSRDATTAIRTLAFYALLSIVVMYTLYAVYVPLTAFTIFGGAMAIGVGFGSQALINNFVGGLIMLAERPVRIGERIVFGNHDGVVEEVGMRSTKLRTAQDHLVTIPNSTLVHESIENVGRRRTINRNFRLAIGYDTPREKIVEAMEAIRAILEEPGIREQIHPVVSSEKLPPRVHFQEYNADSLSIQIVYWYGPPNYWNYMEHAERVNLRIYEEFERLGVSFASPTKTVYLAAEPGLQLPVGGPRSIEETLTPPVRRAG